MPVGVLLRSITSYELTEWMAYFSLKGKSPGPKAPESLNAPVDTAATLKSMFANKVKKIE